MPSKQNRTVSEKQVPQGLYFINRTLQCTDSEISSSSSPAGTTLRIVDFKYRPLRDFGQEESVSAVC
jgi:hypothetical protein